MAQNFEETTSALFQLLEKNRDAILSLSFAQLQKKLQHGQLKAVDVLKAYMAQVRNYLM